MADDGTTKRPIFDVRLLVQIVMFLVPILLTGLFAFSDLKASFREAVAVINMKLIAVDRDLDRMETKIEKIDGKVEALDERVDGLPAGRK